MLLIISILGVVLAFRELGYIILRMRFVKFFLFILCFFSAARFARDQTEGIDQLGASLTYPCMGRTAAWRSFKLELKENLETKDTQYE